MSTAPPLFSEIQKLATEQRNPRSAGIDTASVREILEIISSEDRLVAGAVYTQIDQIEEAVKIIEHAFRHGGRLFYAGAGTSGRLGILDASECPPTFGTKPDLVQGLIAGGLPAVFQSQEGAEDLEEGGKQALVDAGVGSEDVVCGIAASSRTPYVIGALKYAKTLGCKTLFITCAPLADVSIDVDVPICAVVGPEVVMGSTRMKSGTAQKMILNMLTTASMIRLGKVYENMMVDLQMTNAKLVERSKRTVMSVTGLDYSEATTLLGQADGHVKTALVIHLASVDQKEASLRLERAAGFVRLAVQNKSYSLS
jgi:N-acetylmuramic acid 6-phosphate etherase